MVAVGRSRLEIIQSLGKEPVQYVMGTEALKWSHEEAEEIGPNA